jgi:hypothetical protein
MCVVNQRRPSKRIEDAQNHDRDRRPARITRTDGTAERYEGTIRRLGIDVGFSNRITLRSRSERLRAMVIGVR